MSHLANTSALTKLAILSILETDNITSLVFLVYWQDCWVLTELLTLFEMSFGAKHCQMCVKGWFVIILFK